MLTPITTEDFAGIDLRADVLSVRCRSQSNVWVPNEGVLEARPGYETFASPPSQPQNVYVTSRRVYAHSNAATIQIFDQHTGALDHTSAFTVGVGNLVPHGAPGTTRAYYGSGSTNASITRIDEVTPSTTSVATPSRGWLAVTPASNRLMIAARNGPAGTDARVYFSDAGAPETFGANNYVDLDPSDFQTFTGAVTWLGLTFVFKHSKFYIFYGESVSATGTPVFNYRAVRVGVGIPLWAEGNVVAGPDGVYFQSFDGIYHTSGGEPRKISDAIDPLFRNGRLDRLSSEGLSMFARVDATSLSKMAWHRDHLYVPLLIDNTGGSSIESGGLLVWDSRTNRWFVWSSVLTTTLASGPVGDATGADLYEQLVFAPEGANPAAASSIHTFRDFTATTDAGAAISAFYASGFDSLGGSGSEIVLREAELTGRGDNMTLQWFRDLQPTAQSSQAFTVGTGSGYGPSSTMVPGRARLRTAARGNSLSWRVSGNAPWRVQRLVAWPREIRTHGRTTP